MKKLYFRARSGWSLVGLFILVLYGGTKYGIKNIKQYSNKELSIKDLIMHVIDDSYFKDPLLENKPIIIHDNEMVLLSTEEIRRPIKLIGKNLVIASSFEPSVMHTIKALAAPKLSLHEVIKSFFKVMPEKPKLFIIKDLQTKDGCFESVLIDNKINSGLSLAKYHSKDSCLLLKIAPKNLNKIETLTISENKKDSMQKSILINYLGLRNQ